MKKRILSMLLACMLLNSLPVAASTEEVQPECSHVCDESCGYVAPAAAVTCDKDCKPVCNCGTDDASIHATTCAVYAAPEKPECHCVEKCLEANIWCDVCGIDYSLCSGTGKAEAYTDHKHCLSVHEDCTGHDDAVTWTAWEKTDSLPTSGNYYLTEDVTLSTQHTVSQTLNLCLNGHTITPSGSDFGAIKITGNLSLTDCQGNGKITGFTNKSGKGGAVYSEGTFTMYGGIISGNKVGAKYYTDSMGGGVYSEGTFTMYGGTISDNEAQRFGGGVYVASGKQFTMSGGTISGNKVTTTGNAQTYGGGGVYVAGDTFTMTGGTISGNEAGRCGGGVCIGNNTDNKTSGTFTMSDGTISGNKAMYGGGVYIDSKKQFTMSDGTISGNTSSEYGGGVSVYGTFNMNNGTISGNNAGYGGGVYIGSESSFTMTGGNITGNAATNNGGGVYMIRGATAFNLSGSPTISGNTGDNCYINNYDDCFITVTGALDENAKIGITTWSSMSSRPFCKPANSVDFSNYENRFFSDSVDRAIAKNGDGSLYTKQVTTYALTFDSEKAKVTVRGIGTTKAAEGDIVVISPIVPEGATVESVTATWCTVIKNEDGTYSFTMPADAVTITVTFNYPTVDVTGVTLVKDTLELAVGDSETLTAIVAPDNATNKNVSWTSSNTEVATVDETGKVTAVGAGTATITVKTEDGEFTDTRTVTVVEKYDLSVGGVQVTSDNKGDLVTAINQAANDTVATGSATYNPETCTLTLDNFSCSSDAFGGVINIQRGDITIKLKGNNTLTGTGENTDGIYTAGNLVICNGEDGVAQGQLTINTVKACINAPLGTLEITDAKVTATSTEDYGLAAKSISLSGVTLSATADGGTICTDSVYLVDPETGEFVFDPETGSPVMVYGAINIENSTVEAYCTDTVWGNYAFEAAPNISGTFAVTAGNDAASAVKVDAPTAETYTTSKYVRIVPAYTVTYMVGENEVYTEKVEPGKDVVHVPEVPAKEGYTAVWSAEGKNITADTEINAVYTVKKYTVTYKADGKVVKTMEVEHGKDVANVPEVPAKEGYTAAWSADSKNITADTEINAVYTVKKYTVTYKADGKVVKTVEVEHGKDATAPEIPAKEGYNETAPKWDKDGKNITADTTINAVYTKNQPGTFTSITPTTNAGGGKITDKVHKLKEKIPFTQEEALQIEYGADVEVWLEIEDISTSVPADDKKEIEKKLGDGDVAMYLDIVMFKQVGENEASRLTQLSDKVQITFQLPDSYINTDQNVTRTYSIIHVHDGEAEIITPVFDAATKTLTFETDRFSTYGVVYADEKITPPAEETVPPTEKPTPPAEIPATGDSFQPVFWIACMTLSIFGIAVLLLDAKRRHAR